MYTYIIIYIYIHYITNNILGIPWSGKSQLGPGLGLLLRAQRLVGLRGFQGAQLQGLHGIHGRNWCMALWYGSIIIYTYYMYI